MKATVLSLSAIMMVSACGMDEMGGSGLDAYYSYQTAQIDAAPGAAVIMKYRQGMSRDERVRLCGVYDLVGPLSQTDAEALLSQSSLLGQRGALTSDLSFFGRGEEQCQTIDQPFEFQTAHAKLEVVVANDEPRWAGLYSTGQTLLGAANSRFSYGAMN
jgi:hypothetical protein